MVTAAAKPENVKRTVRPPIVVVMGHIDHGKTTLLDFIREAKVADSEAGGITQAIGAYQVEHRGKKITFIDTPGHEAFSAMRSRGTHVADIAVLVVAADEGVKPQTEEALRSIQQNELPFVVAINKIDKPAADPSRVKQEFAKSSVLVEGFGGTVPVVELSAKSGQGVEGLLETILLLAELEELEGDPEKQGEGVVIESHLDPQRGATATLLIEDGVVRRGDYIVIDDQAAPVRIFENFRGEAIDAASAAEPIRITGFRHAPALGERFATFKTRDEAEEWKAALPRDAPAALGGRPAAPEGDKTIINIILKADVLGSLEVLESTLAAIDSPELGNRVLKREVGAINESDVKLAAASARTIIVGFKVKIPAAISELAERHSVTVVIREVIYDLIDALKSAMLAVAPAKTKRITIGTARILALFREERGKQIVGGRVESGEIRRGLECIIIRNQMNIGSGRILTLQSERRAVEVVAEGREFGISIGSDIAIAVGDTLELFMEEQLRPRL